MRLGYLSRARLAPGTASGSDAVDRDHSAVDRLREEPQCIEIVVDEVPGVHRVFIEGDRRDARLAVHHDVGAAGPAARVFLTGEGAVLDLLGGELVVGEVLGEDGADRCEVVHGDRIP